MTKPNDHALIKALGNAPDTHLAKRFKTTRQAVQAHRQRRGIPSYTEKHGKVDLTKHIAFSKKDMALHKKAIIITGKELSFTEFVRTFMRLVSKGIIQDHIELMEDKDNGK